MRHWTGRARRAAFAGYTGAGSACAACGALAALCGQFDAAAACVAGLGVWAAIGALRGPVNWLRECALGTRAPRPDLFDRELAAMPASFKAAGPIERAERARADRALQRRLWWEASSVMWMRANPADEHRWRASVASPGWLDDARAWRDETAEKLARAAQAGWVCPRATVAWLMEMPEREGMATSVGAAIPYLALLPEPWPARARFDHGLGAMGRDLYGSDFGEQLAGVSEAAIDALGLVVELGRGRAKAPARRL